jgi:hypothetical protein
MTLSASCSSLPSCVSIGITQQPLFFPSVWKCIAPDCFIRSKACDQRK